MIDLLVKLLDKFILFFKSRKEAEEKAFELLVTPIFESLQTIHEDYLQMFEALKQELEKGTDMSSIAKRLMKDRLEQEALRQSIIAFVDIYLGNDRLSKYDLFFRAVKYYFRRSDFVRHAGSRASMLLMEMETWVREEQRASLAPWQSDEGAKAREVLLDTTKIFLQEIRRSWTEVSERYAALVAQRAKG